MHAIVPAIAYLKYLAWTLAALAIALPCPPAAKPANPSPYLLPFPAGTTTWVGQGYDGVFEPHHAYDFLLPLGTPVLAARDGIVTRIIDNHDGNCPFTKTCPNNLIYLRHGRGTPADPITETRYLHIRMGSACVHVGDHVRQGQQIAATGCVGISMVPHIHFELRTARGATVRAAFAEIPAAQGRPQYFRFYTSRNGHRAFRHVDRAAAQPASQPVR